MKRIVIACVVLLLLSMSYGQGSYVVVLPTLAITHTKDDHHIACQVNIEAGVQQRAAIEITELHRPEGAIYVWLEDHDPNTISLDSTNIVIIADPNNRKIEVTVTVKLPQGQHDVCFGMRDDNFVESHEYVRFMAGDTSPPVITGCRLVQ